jgi:hypothetical protein
MLRTLRVALQDVVRSAKALEGAAESRKPAM